MTGLVLDASVAITWCYPDEQTPYALSVLQALRKLTVVVPSLWPLEVANALLMGERRARLTAAEGAKFVSMLRTLAVEVDPQTPDRAPSDTMQLARIHQLTCYDAAYLELAMRRGLPLATLVAKLAAAAKSAGVPLFS